MPYDVLIRGGQVVLSEHGVQEADLVVDGGRIVGILAPGAAVAARAVLDARGLHVLPGALDTHTHWGYRGDFAVQCRSDSRAAALGGTTTALLLHRVRPGEFPALRRQGETLAAVDFALSPAIYDEATAAQIDAAIGEWGCPSFKFYLAYRKLPGAPPGDDWNELTDGLLWQALVQLGRYRGTLACVHAENAEIVSRAIAQVRAAGRDGLAAWEAANPGVAEAEAIHRAAFLGGEAGVAVYFVHLSGRDALRAVTAARARAPRPVYAETCPHYLVHNVERSPPTVKFSPPVRHRADNEALWEALADGRLDCVGSDNASTLAESKRGSVWEIVRGGPGAGVLLPVVLSEGVNKGRLSLERAAQVTATNAARIFGLYPQKGVIQVGADADLAIVDLALKRAVTPTLLGTWSDYSLYDGVAFTGWPVITMVRGQVVARDGVVTVEPGFGRFLPRWAARGLSPLRERGREEP